MDQDQNEAREQSASSEVRPWNHPTPSSPIRPNPAELVSHHRKVQAKPTYYALQQTGRAYSVFPSGRSGGLAERSQRQRRSREDGDRATSGHPTAAPPAPSFAAPHTRTPPRCLGLGLGLGAAVPVRPDGAGSCGRSAAQPRVRGRSSCGNLWLPRGRSGAGPWFSAVGAAPAAWGSHRPPPARRDGAVTRSAPRRRTAAKREKGRGSDCQSNVTANRSAQLGEEDQ